MPVVRTRLLQAWTTLPPPTHAEKALPQVPRGLLPGWTRVLTRTPKVRCTTWLLLFSPPPRTQPPVGTRPVQACRSQPTLPLTCTHVSLSRAWRVQVGAAAAATRGTRQRHGPATRTRRIAIQLGGTFRWSVRSVYQFLPYGEGTCRAAAAPAVPRDSLGRCPSAPSITSRHPG